MLTDFPTEDAGSSESRAGGAVAPPSNVGSTDPGPAPERSSLWRRLLPFGVSLGLIAYVLRDIDLHAFATRVAAVNAPAFLLFFGLFVLVSLTADTFATVIVYRRTVAPVRFRDFWVLRGASYLPALLNHHLAQAFITYFISRTYGVPLARVVGATLLVYASWSGCLLSLACVAFVVTSKSLWWLAPVLGAGGLALAVLAARPRRLAGIKFLAPLFDAGLSGYVFALFVRLPHFAVMFLGTWLPFKFFGIDIPLGAALTYVPMLMVLVTIPITPQGFGTREVVAAALFESFAPGATHGERLASLAAATTSFGVIITLMDALLGLLLLRRASAQMGK